MSPNYDLLRQALLQGKQVLFDYHGYRREASPYAIGLKHGKEKFMCFQYAGGSKTGLPRGGQWRCLFIAEVSNVQLFDGSWHNDGHHSQPQTCIDAIDVEVWLGPDGQTPYVKRA